MVRVTRHRATEDARRPDGAALPQAARRREPRHLDARASRSCSRRSPGSARAAGRTTGGSCGRTACSSSTAGRRPIRPGSPGAGGSKGNAADRRLVRDEPGGGGDLRQEAAGDGADRRRHRQLLPPDRARRRARRREERGGRPRADRLHALGALPGGGAREHVRAAGAQRDAAAGRVPPLRRLARRGRSSSRRPRSDATATAGSTSGHGPSCAETRLERRRRARARGVRGALLRVPAGRDPRARPHLRRRALAARRNGRAALVHDLAGGRVDRAHARGRTAARVGDRPVPVPRPLARARARAGAVRAADRRRRHRVPGAAPGRLRAGHLGDPRRPRVLQRRRRDAHRRRGVGDDRSRERRGRRRARGGPAAASTRGDAAPAGTRALGRRRADVPLLLHLVRRHPHPRRARAGHARDGDLQPGGAPLRPPGRRRALAAAARRRRRRARPSRASSRRAPAARAPWPTRATCSAARAGAQRIARRRGARLGGARARAPSRRSRPPVARQLGRALPGDAGAPRGAVAGGRLLGGVRERRGARSRSSSAGSPPSRSRDDRRASSTGSSCSRSAPPP